MDTRQRITPLLHSPIPQDSRYTEYLNQSPQLSSVNFPLPTLLGNRAISSHFSPSESLISALEALNYPWISLRNLKSCGDPTGDFIYAQCNCKVRSIPITNHCNLSVCPSCIARRKRRILSDYLPILNKIKLLPGHQFRFLTFSPENFPTLKQGLKAVRKAYNKFLRLKYIKDRVQGGIYVIEAKNNQGKGWNVHVHAILYSRWLDNRMQPGQKDSKLTKIFQKASGSAVNMDIRLFGNSKLGALKYMLKYISSKKSDFLNVESHAEYISTTYKRRLITTFGDGFYKGKREKAVCYCSDCSSKITFIWEPLVTYIHQEALREQNKPPTKDLYTWTT